MTSKTPRPVDLLIAKLPELSSEDAITLSKAAHLQVAKNAIFPYFEKITMEKVGVHNGEFQLKFTRRKGVDFENRDLLTQLKNGIDLFRDLLNTYIAKQNQSIPPQRRVPPLGETGHSGVGYHSLRGRLDLGSAELIFDPSSRNPGADMYSYYAGEAIGAINSELSQYTSKQVEVGG